MKSIDIVKDITKQIDVLEIVIIDTLAQKGFKSYELRDIEVLFKDIKADVKEQLEEYKSRPIEV